MKSMEAELAVLTNDFFQGHPVSLDMDLEGQSIDEQGNFILGGRAGPGVEVSNLVHEMAHLAEREIPKLLEKPNFAWGFSFGKYWEVFGQSGFEPQTDRSVLRERDVWAYQISICHHYGISLETEDEEGEEEIYQVIKSAVYLPAFCLYARNLYGHLDYKDREEKALRHLAAEVKELSETKFTFDRFCDEWYKRMKALV